MKHHIRRVLRLAITGKWGMRRKKSVFPSKVGKEKGGNRRQINIMFKKGLEKNESLS